MIRLRGTRRALLLVVSLGVAFALGAASHHPNAAVPKAEDSALLRSLDQLEVNLTESTGWVEHQRDLKRRHEQVSAIACVNVGEHSKDSARIVAEHLRRQKRHDDDLDTGDVTTASAPPSLNGRKLASAHHTP